MKQLVYDLYIADKNNINNHPQIQMKNLGFKIIHGVPQSLGDCWWFTVEDFDFQLPEYIEERKNLYNLKYWKDKCWETCEYFEKNPSCCQGGFKCLKEENKCEN